LTDGAKIRVSTTSRALFRDALHDVEQGNEAQQQNDSDDLNE
jgi:hypothetical protein